MAAFTWVPSYGTQANNKPRVLETQFGDGYAQRAGDGINSNPQTWAITFIDIPPADADAIDTFLGTQAGVTPFDWTTPKGDALRFTCSDWHRTYDSYGGHGVTATFVQDFSP